MGKNRGYLNSMLINNYTLLRMFYLKEVFQLSTKILEKKNNARLQNKGDLF